MALLVRLVEPSASLLPVLPVVVSLSYPLPPYYYPYYLPPLPPLPPPPYLPPGYLEYLAALAIYPELIRLYVELYRQYIEALKAAVSGAGRG